MNELQKLSDADLVRMFFIISDQYIKSSADEDILSMNREQISRLARKLRQVFREIQKRGIPLKRAE